MSMFPLLPSEWPKEVKDAVDRILEESKRSGIFMNTSCPVVRELRDGIYWIETDYMLNGKQITKGEEVIIKKKGC